MEDIKHLLRSGSLPEIVRTHAIAQPDYEVFVYLDDSGFKKSSVTYAQLNELGTQVAEMLALVRSVSPIVRFLQQSEWCETR